MSGTSPSTLPDGPLTRRESRLAWAFVLPALVTVLLIGLYPLAETVRLGFTDARRGSPDAGAWVGMANHAKLLADPAFRASLANTALFASASVAIEFCLGLGIALFLNREMRGRGFLRAAMLVPWALPTVVASRMWSWMFNDVFGVVNDLLVRKLGIVAAPIAWTATPGLAMGVLIFIDVWKTTPFIALILLAGLQTIPRDLYEAATVDGASRIQQFRRVTLPLLMPSIAVALVFRSLDAVRVFDLIWVVTAGQFGTESMATYTYRHLMTFNKLGYGAAASTIVFLATAAVAAVLLTSLRVGRSEPR